MLSVLIPTYNYNAFFLAKKIHNQLISENINFEIICIDDGSHSEINSKNEKINSLSFSKFEELDKNIGRSAIRNFLAKKAKYNWLLFLDADVLPVKSAFIKKYITCFKSKNTVFCGGILYENNPKNENLLRYKYGKKHEEISIKKRTESPEKYFFTSNFLLEKNIFNSLKFEEKLTQYGKEDLLFSQELKEHNYKIEHLENQVFHLGLDSNLVFVSKTKKAIENLLFLEKNNILNVEKIPILKLVKNLSKFKIARIVGKLYTYCEKLAIKNSSVFSLNCMKVSYLCFLETNNK